MQHMIGNNYKRFGSVLKLPVGRPRQVRGLLRDIEPYKGHIVS